MRNYIPPYFKYISIGILGILLLLGLTTPSYSSAARKKTLDARVVADMSQLRSSAELIYDKEKSYTNVHCEYGDIKLLCDDIKKVVGSKPTIHQTIDKYCAYVQLNSGAFTCVDSRLTFKYTTWINPVIEGYCDGQTFVCPKEEGTPLPGFPRLPKKTFEEIFNQMILIISGVIALGIIILALRRSLKKRKEEIIKKESWVEIKQEIKSKKWFYIFLILLILYPVVLIISTMYADIEEAIGLVGLIIAGGMIFLSFTSIKNTLKNSTKMVCWETYAAPLCLVVFWLMILIPEYLRSFVKFSYYISLLNFPMSISTFILGIGFSIGAIIHPGKLNKILGIIMLLVFVFFILIFLSLSGG